MTYHVQAIPETPGWVLEHSNTKEPVAVVTQFFQYLHARQYSNATMRAYAYGLRSFWDWLEERDVDFGAVRRGQLVEYLEATRIPSGARGMRLSARTLNQRLAVLNSFFAWWQLVHDDQTLTNPAAPVPTQTP